MKASSQSVAIRLLSQLVSLAGQPWPSQRKTHQVRQNCNEVLLSKYIHLSSCKTTYHISNKSGRNVYSSCWRAFNLTSQKHQDYLKPSSGTLTINGLASKVLACLSCSKKHHPKIAGAILSFTYLEYLGRWNTFPDIFPSSRLCGHFVPSMLDSFRCEFILPQVDFLSKLQVSR